MGASINCLFSRLLRHRFFAPAPKVGALGEIGIPYILYITTVLVRQPGQSSRILYTLRFSARCFLALKKKSELIEVHLGFQQTIHTSALIVAHLDPFSSAGILVINMKTSHRTTIQV